MYEFRYDFVRLRKLFDEYANLDNKSKETIVQGIRERHPDEMPRFLALNLFGIDDAIYHVITPPDFGFFASDDLDQIAAWVTESVSEGIVNGTPVADRFSVFDLQEDHWLRPSVQVRYDPADFETQPNAA